MATLVEDKDTQTKVKKKEFTDRHGIKTKDLERAAQFNHKKGEKN